MLKHLHADHCGTACGLRPIRPTADGANDCQAREDSSTTRHAHMQWANSILSSKFRWEIIIKPIYQEGLKQSERQQYLKFSWNQSDHISVEPRTWYVGKIIFNVATNDAQGNKFIQCGHNLFKRGNKLVQHGHKLLKLFNKLVWRGHDWLKRGNKINTTCPQKTKTREKMTTAWPLFTKKRERFSTRWSQFTKKWYNVAAIY